MSLEQSVKEMVKRLQLNREFPKYQFERSFDIFLSLFLDKYFSIKYKAEIVYVAAEFPMRKEKSETTDKDTYQSTNVDYLLLRKDENPLWYFIELKTDLSSQREVQLKRLNDAKKKTFGEFYDQIYKVSNPKKGISGNSNKRHKYNALKHEIYEHTKETPDIYMHAAVQPICLTSFPPGDSIKKRYDCIEWVQLSEFDAILNNTQHPELWQIVKILFKEYTPESQIAEY